MAKSNSQISTCKVIDNSMFPERSEILIQEDGYNTPVYAEIMTPIGGLPNMAMQWVPPVNAEGYIMYKSGGDKRRPVWVGAKLMPWDAAGAEKVSDVDFRPGVVEADDSVTDFILKTQNNTYENQDMDHKDNKVENILKMSKGEFTLAKVQQTDNYEYKIENYDVKAETYYQIITMQDDKIVIKFNSSETEGEGATLTLTEGKCDLVTQYGDTTCTLTMDENGINTDAGGKSTITIDKDGNTTVTCKKMVVDADKIELGGNSKTAALMEPIRDFVNQTYMTHVHPTPSGPSGPPSPTSTNFGSTKVKLV